MTVAEIAIRRDATLVRANGIDIAYRVYRTIPGAELAIIPGTGHAINRAVIDAMVSFLAGAP